MARRLLNTQRLVNLASDPTSGSSGEIYFNNSNNVLKFHDGSIWSEIGGSGGATISTTIPEVGANGSFYFNSVDLILYVAVDGAWIEVGWGLPFDGGLASTTSFNGSVDGGSASDTQFDGIYDSGSSLNVVELLA